MRVAVTGGSGVVGTAVIGHLVDEGHEVRALARSSESVAKLGSMGAVPVWGDILDQDSLAEVVEGCELVFHLAGINEMCTRRRDHMWKVNVEGSRLMMNAAARAGVRRMIHTSSAVTIGEAAGTVGTEETVHRGYYLSDYERTKTEAERLVMSAPDGLEMVIVNPSSVQGPGRATGTGRLLLGAARGRIPFVISTSLSLVDIDDCARGHLLASRLGAPGERYLLSGAVLTMEEAIDLLSSVTGRELRPRFIPKGVATALGAIVETAARPFGRTPPMCREAVRVVAHGHRYDGSKATRELGLAYTAIEDTLSRTIEWFRAEGML